MRGRWHSRQQRLGDVVLTLALYGFGLWEVLIGPIADSVVEGPAVLNVAAVSMATVPVVACRWAPPPAAALVALATGVRPLLAGPLELFAPVLAMVVSHTQ